MRRLSRFLLENRTTVLITAAALCGVGVWAFQKLPVDALPDVSENQIIVSVDWPGISPVDMEDQITYPLSSSLQGLPEVKQVRAISSFGFAQIYVVFNDNTDLYWARERVSERLEEIKSELPDGASVNMGPDATPLGQIYWYSLQGPLDLGELRALQDYTVRPVLESIPGVAEVSSIGGFQREYAVEVDPDRLRHLGITIQQVITALSMSNTDTGAGTVEQTGMELIVRVTGSIRNPEDIQNTYITSIGGRPVTVGEVARVSLGPGFRRGALADGRGELTGGIVVMRYGADPVKVIESVEERIDRIAASLPSGVEIVPYYNRRILIQETVGTLTGAITWQMVITALVVLAFLFHMKTSLSVASTLPFAVLVSFIGMKLLSVDANIMSFAGIAIAIGTIVDMGIVISESIHQERRTNSTREGIVRAVSRVAPAIATSLSTTVISFIPVFFLQGQSGRLFAPLAWTKTLVLVAAGVTAVTLVPVLLSFSVANGRRRSRKRVFLPCILFGSLGAWLSFSAGSWIPPLRPWFLALLTGGTVFAACFRIATESYESGIRDRFERMLTGAYVRVLEKAMKKRKTVLAVFILIILAGSMAAVGASDFFRPLGYLGIQPARVRPVAFLNDLLPGLGTQFMPPLNEGSFLFMPSLLVQASLNETVEVMISQNRAMEDIPEVDLVVGKAGRSDSPLDPAPVGMIETVITLHPRDMWRDGVTSDSILTLLRNSVRMPGIAPSWLQPIETRIVMLQSGIVTNIGLEIRGDDIDELERVAVAAENILTTVPGATDVSALRTSRRPYVEVTVKRNAAALRGFSVNSVTSAVVTAMSGTVATTVLSGRERIPVRVRYSREDRDETGDIGRIYVAGHGDAGPTLVSTLAEIETVPGPAVIRSVDGELVSYVMLNARGRDEGGLVSEADQLLRDVIEADRELPPNERNMDLPEGYHFRWIGNYRNQKEAEKRFGLLIPLCLAAIFFLMYLQFKTLSVPMIIFLGTVPLAIAGGILFLQIWPGIHSVLWDLGVIGIPPEGAVHITVAVIVGFIALMGICVDDGVLMATYMTQLKRELKPGSKAEIRALTLEAASRRIRPAVMTTVTTLIALVPVLLSSGRGSDLARPMALPVFGGMLIELFTIMIVPLAYSWWMERKLSVPTPISP